MKKTKPEVKVYTPKPDTISINMEQVEREIGLPGAAHQSNLLPEPPEEMSKRRGCYRKGVSVCRK